MGPGVDIVYAGTTDRNHVFSPRLAVLPGSVSSTEDKRLSVSVIEITGASGLDRTYLRLPGRARKPDTLPA